MKVTIEFTGIARSIADAKSIDLDLPERTTYRDLVKLLAQRYPAFIGVLIAPDGENFLSSNMFVIDGDLAFPAMILDESPAEGSVLYLMSVITGG